MRVLGETADGSVGRGVLYITLQKRDRRGAGGTSDAHYIQCGGRCSVPPLGVTCSRVSWGGAIVMMMTMWDSQRRERQSRRGTMDEGGWKRDMHI